MATNIVYIHDLPFRPRRQLCRILDADRRWEELGGNYMSYDVTTLTLIGQAVQREQSPTWELLNKYSQKNGTIRHLFLMLAKMDHQRAMSVLQPYVDAKYHCLLRNESLRTSTFLSCSKQEHNPGPNFSQFSVSCNESSYQWTQSSIHKGIPSEVSSSSKTKECSPHSTSKLKGDSANMKENYSSVSLQSKMNSLNVSESNSKAVAGEKSANKNNVKKSNLSKESLSDNCVSEKLKNIKKSTQDVPPNKKYFGQTSPPLDAASINSQEDSLLDIMHITYNDICKATNNFDDNRILGKGGFGIVYKGDWKGTSVAIKKLTPRNSSDEASQHVVSFKQSLNELNVLKRCRFDHILPLYAVSLDGTFPCLVYQLMVNGSLEDRLLCKNKTPPLTWSQRSHIAECTTKGLNYLHTAPEKPLVHGDIKSANILLDANMDAKIGDFGLTREGPGCDVTHVKVSSVHGTQCYLPPEYLRQRHLSPQVDIYSYGIVLLEIATGLRPFDQKRGEAKRLVDYVELYRESGRLDNLRDIKAGEEKMVWFGELIQIGHVCSKFDKKKRPPMQEVLDRFEKIKAEISVMDKIRRMSNDRGTSLKSNLTPLELQVFYDLQNNTSNASTNSKFPATLQQNDVSEMPVRVEKSKDLNCSNTKSSTISTESLATSDSFDSTDYCQNELSTNQACANNENETARNDYTFDGKAPVPLISLLRCQLSANDSVISTEESDNCTSSNITENPE